MTYLSTNTDGAEVGAEVVAYFWNNFLARSILKISFCKGSNCQKNFSYTRSVPKKRQTLGFRVQRLTVRFIWKKFKKKLKRQVMHKVLIMFLSSNNNENTNYKKNLYKTDSQTLDTEPWFVFFFKQREYTDASHSHLSHSFSLSQLI